MQEDLFVFSAPSMASPCFQCFLFDLLQKHVRKQIQPLYSLNIILDIINIEKRVVKRLESSSQQKTIYLKV